MAACRKNVPMTREGKIKGALTTMSPSCGRLFAGRRFFSSLLWYTDPSCLRTRLFVSLPKGTWLRFTFCVATPIPHTPKHKLSEYLRYKNTQQQSPKLNNIYSHSLTSGLNLELKVTFVLMQRSISQAAASATYPPAALDDDNICACGGKQKVNKQR